MIKITIQEVANNFSLSKDTLRYYEKEGLIDPVKKNKSGIREYTEEDLKRIEFIKCMRSSGLSIEVLKKYVELFNKGKSTVKERKDLLIGQREKLLEKQEDIKKTLDRLNYKIELYDDIVSGKRKDFMEEP